MTPAQCRGEPITPNGMDFPARGGNAKPIAAIAKAMIETRAPTLPVTANDRRDKETGPKHRERSRLRNRHAAAGRRRDAGKSAIMELTVTDKGIGDQRAVDLVVAGNRRAGGGTAPLI